MLEALSWPSLDVTVPAFVSILYLITDRAGAAGLWLAIKTGLKEFNYLWEQMIVHCG
jgi:hypothetical protein